MDSYQNGRPGYRADQGEERRPLREAPGQMFTPVGRKTTGGGPVPTWLHWLAVLTALASWVLVFSGGLVTSKGVGLSVPDWPTSYGYNMFAFPVSRWVGGIFFEHVHRLLASTVGLLTIGVTAGLWYHGRRSLRILGFVALGAVVLQGLLGGLRVVLLSDKIGIFHACLAQAFFALMSFIALATSRWWSDLGNRALPDGQARTRALAWMVVGVAGFIYLQLVLGAGMRHAHAGLSIPDFPSAYGYWWPPTDAASVAGINQTRLAAGIPQTSAGLILLQMFHRLGAVVVAAGVVLVAVAAAGTGKELPAGIRALAYAGLPLVALQVILGIYTIWTNKAADVATGHVAVGAATLVWSVLTAATLFRCSAHPAQTAMPRAPGQQNAGLRRETAAV